jgi:hypothetical protein
MRHKIQELYFALLPIVFIPTGAIGIANGMRFGLDNKDPFTSFCGTIGFTSIGMITGITYPISFPLLAGYVLLQKQKKEE